MFPKTSSRRVCNTSSKNVFKTSWIRLEGIFARRPQDVLKTSLRRACETSSLRHLPDVFKKTYCNYVLKTSSRRLEDAMEDRKCYIEDAFKTSSRRLQCVFRTFSPRQMFAGNLYSLLVFKMLLLWIPLCKKCPYLEFFGPYFPSFGLSTEKYGVSLCIQSKCGKTRTRNTRNLDTFHSVIIKNAKNKSILKY